MPLVIARAHRWAVFAAAVACLVLAGGGGLQRAAQARVAPPAVPANLEVTGADAVLTAHATGTQNYICLPSAHPVSWVFVAPQATLLGHHRQIGTHFLSPDPAGAPSPTWQANDGNTVWARPVESSTDPAFVAAAAIPWLKLEVVASRGSGQPVGTTFIQRIHTMGGVAPTTGCTTQADAGRLSFQPYRADYVFFRPRAGEHGRAR